MTRAHDCLQRRVVFAYASGQFAASLLPLLLGAWVLYFYSPPGGERRVLLAPAIFGTIRLVERIFGAMFEPLIGWLSDRTRTGLGRRRPWIIFGAPILAIAFASVWFPPKTVAPNSALAIGYAAFALAFFNLAFTAVICPYAALLPELSSDPNERVRISVWMAAFEVLANIVGLGGAALVVALGPTKWLGIDFDNGFELMGIGAAILATIALVPTATWLREPHNDVTSNAPLGFRDAIAHSLGNGAFRRYAAIQLGLRAAILAAITGMPFLATELMGLEIDAASAMLAILIVVAAMTFPLVQKMAARRGNARVLRLGAWVFVATMPVLGTIGLVPGVSPLVHGAVLLAISGFSVATFLVLPRTILADVIDDDERHTGRRREAMYTGMSGIVEKVGEAIGAAALAYVFQAFGNSAAEPLGLRLVGVVAACAVGVGLIGFRPLREGPRAIEKRDPSRV